ncbi:MAG: tRNA (guanosine(46)-N7)-methyltransferase TrmB [Acholeplasmataceae bacterium]|nr:tRNA (guanosine(46)-N7)-methyltransferase TrmB [Acholeplasmataceae bacterium]
MRQKKVKYATKEILEAYGVIIEPKRLEFKEKRAFLEIGSGKGSFISSLANDHPDDIFIAMEININVCYRIIEKKEAMKLDNLIIIHGDASFLNLYFDSDSIDGIYLNFSDPWPKKKHHKRRLTYPTFLKTYQNLLKDHGFLQFRTDHPTLFQESVEYIENHFKIIEINNHLEESRYMTEYEIKKRVLGPIYQLIGKVEKNVKESL